MTYYYTCGHQTLYNDDGEPSNGSYALWETTDVDWMGENVYECYGSLCWDCIPRYEARACLLGGIEIDKV
jgi:hypothetical protein